MTEDASTNRDDEQDLAPPSDEERERARADRACEAEAEIRAIIERHRETLDKLAE